MAWYRCDHCGEGFMSDAIELRPVHVEDHDGWACNGTGKRMRTPPGPYRKDDDDAG
jgi:hypothetical protein